ncbi:MAG: hypothetical protein NVS3B5_14840 [Sphingomicrobium sp.]
MGISYGWAQEEGLYLAAVTNRVSRRIVRFAIGDRVPPDLARAALRKALVIRRSPGGLIHL